jgi:hypothetical protein
MVDAYQLTAEIASAIFKLHSQVAPELMEERRSLASSSSLLNRLTDGELTRSYEGTPLPEILDNKRHQQQFMLKEGGGEEEENDNNNRY